MSIGDSSFEDLLKEAPEAPDESVVTLTGVLARSRENDKFVLYVGEQNSLTLPISAVRHHQVIGSSIGQTVVQLTVDKSALPDHFTGGDLNGIFKAKADPFPTMLEGYPTRIEATVTPGASSEANAQLFHTIFAADHKQPILDKPPFLDHTVFALDNSTISFLDHGKPPIIDTPLKTVDDGPFGPGGGGDPFSLAARHQAAVAQLFAQKSAISPGLFPHWHPIWKTHVDPPKVIPDDR